MSEIVIEKHIELPPRARRSRRYPLDKMEVGDSFMVEENHTEMKRLRARLNSTIKTFRREHPDREFTTRTITERQIRVWRTK